MSTPSDSGAVARRRLSARLEPEFRESSYDDEHKFSPAKVKNVSHIPCRFFKAGVCSAGKACPFSHNIPEPGQPKEVCKWYLRGSCKFGHKCALAHGESAAMDRKNKRAAHMAAKKAAAAGSQPSVTDLNRPSGLSDMMARASLNGGFLPQPTPSQPTSAAPLVAGSTTTNNSVLAASDWSSRSPPGRAYTNVHHGFSPPSPYGADSGNLHSSIDASPLSTHVTSPSSHRNDNDEVFHRSLAASPRFNMLGGGGGGGKPSPGPLTELGFSATPPQQRAAFVDPTIRLRNSEPYQRNPQAAYAHAHAQAHAHAPAPAPAHPHPHAPATRVLSSSHPAPDISSTSPDRYSGFNSPLSVPGTRSIFLSAPVEDEHTASRTLNGLHASKGNSNDYKDSANGNPTRTLGMPIPSAGDPQRNSMQMTMLDSVNGNGDDNRWNDEDGGGEDFLPSSLNELLNEEEKLRRMRSVVSPPSSSPWAGTPGTYRHEALRQHNPGESLPQVSLERALQQPHHHQQQALQQSPQTQPHPLAQSHHTAHETVSPEATWTHSSLAPGTGGGTWMRRTPTVGSPLAREAIWGPPAEQPSNPSRKEDVWAASAPVSASASVPVRPVEEEHDGLFEMDDV